MQRLIWTISLCFSAVLAVCPLSHVDAESPLLTKLPKQKFIRLTRSSAGAPEALQTAVVRYGQPGRSDLQIDFIGAVHFGDPAYYTRLNSLFGQYDVVLYELVAPEGTRIPKGGPDMGPLRSRIQNVLTTFLELDSQLELIDYTAKNFVHADLSMEGLGAELTKRGDSAFTVGLDVLSASLRQQNVLEQKLAGQQSKAAPAAAAAADPLAFLADPQGGLKAKTAFAEQLALAEDPTGMLGVSIGTSVIVDRNKACLAVLEREVNQKQHRKIAIFYGAGHGADLDLRLRLEYGLERRTTEWLTAWDLREQPRSWLSSVGKMWRIFQRW